MQKELRRLKDGPFEGATYYCAGKGFPIVLVHGFPADHTLWDMQTKQLQEKYRLILPDLPGTGQSPLIDPISIEDMADFLKDILIQEGIKKCILIGHSMGGYVTLSFVEKYEDYLTGWGLFHSSAYADNEEKKKGRKRSIELMKKYGQEKFLHQMIPNLFSQYFQKNHRDEVQDLILKRVEAGVDALIPYYHAMWERPDRTLVLKESKTPVLFVIGKEDTSAPMDSVLQQVSLPAVSQVNIFEKAGHLGMLEVPDAAIHILDQFIDFCINNPIE